MGGNEETSFGRYRLLDRLGEGGMAEVFKAKSFGVEGFEKVLVIKRILPKLAEHSRFVDMFVHEAKLAVRLSHANIVQVFDLGRVDRSGQPTSYFIAMEYVPGLDLATILSRCRRAKTALPFGMAVYVAAEVAKALDHAHRRRDEQGRPLGVVHRDISPQNVLLSWEGEVKVTDFGIAKAKDSIEEEAESGAGKIRGKLAYMSPEQSKAEAIDGRSDLFSLGTVLYEMIAGSNPFLAPTAFETLRRVQANEYPPLEILRTDTPAPLLEAVGRLLARAPEDRFADAGKLHEQLLGYFYATGDRFGANQLAEFLDSFRERLSLPEFGGTVFEDEPAAANERTPVEVPTPPSMAARTGSATTTKAVTPARADTGQFRTAEIGERREVTALVLSFGRSARTAEGKTIPPALQPACDIFARYGSIILEKDASQIVALFGLGDADGRDTQAAVRAALVALRTARTGSATSAGIHVARIVVDMQGTPLRDERLISLIASAQGLARSAEGRVVVSALAARIIRTDFTTEELARTGPTAAEGAHVVTSTRSPAATYGRFVGRHDELKKLGEILASATKRRVRLVTVSGDKGIGKTRLLSEVERRLAKGSYNVGFYGASCPQNGADVPWSGLAAMLHTLCGIQEGDDEERVLEVLPRLRALGLQPDESAAVLAQLGARAADAPKLNPLEQSAALRSAFSRMVTSLCEDRLHVFAWDDAHAIDKTTLDAVMATVGRARTRVEGSGLRAVFLFASRSAPAEVLAEHAAHYSLRLGEFSEDDSARLLAIRVGARLLAPELFSFCRERAGGHPLFLEELVRELMDSGALSVTDGELRTRLEGATAVPRTLRTLIASRVSRLDADERAAMQAAAILGEPVFLPALAALLKQSLPQVERTVGALAGRELLRLTGPAQAAFASPMHGEIVLDAIPPEARRELHAAAAEAFVATFGEDSTELAERIAGHLYEAGDRDRAATFFARAAEEKTRTAQLELAIRWMSRALDLADHDRRSGTELTAWLGILSEAVSRARSATDLPNVTGRALKRVDEVGSLEEKVAARANVARAFGSANLFDEAKKRVDEAFVLAGDAEELRTRVLTVELEIATQRGDFVRALDAASKLEALGPIRNARSLLFIAHARATQGEKERALEAIDQASRLEGADEIQAAAEREKVRVLVYCYVRDFRAAVESSARAADLARTLGLRFATAIVLHNLGDASRRLGDLPRAYASLSESREVAEAAGHERLAALNRAHLAYIDGLNGVESAEGLLRDLIRYHESRGYHTDGLESRYLLGSLLKRRGATTEAKRELEEVLRRALEYGNRLVADDAREDLLGL